VNNQIKSCLELRNFDGREIEIEERVGKIVQILNANKMLLRYG
jgi:hypothetical protein